MPYLEDYAWIFPDERLYRRFVEAVKGLITVRVPIVAQMATAVIQSHDPRRTFHVAKLYYRWLDNSRLNHRSLLRPAYAQTQQLFADQTDEYLLLIVDFSNLEKPHSCKKGHQLRFICDRGFDDEKTFAFVVNLDEDFIIRLYLTRILHLQRGRARTERLLAEMVKETRRPIRFQTRFKIRGRWRQCWVTLGYRKVWSPGHSQPCWLVLSNVYG